MLSMERRNQIISLINEKGSVLVQELSNMFSVTEETIRRDLEKLEKQGVLVKTYGGAVLADDPKLEIPVGIREEINIPGKDLIAREAAKMIDEGDTIILDASTSALYVAKHIKNKKELTVITNAVKVLLELADCNGITLISTGGIMLKESLSFSGKASEMTLGNYFADKVFFSCKGLAINRGLTDSNEQVADTKRMMMKSSEKAIFLCDHTKFGRTGCVNTAAFQDIDCVIVDAPLPEGWREIIENAGAEVKLAENSLY